MSGCALQIAVIADALESGAKPYPIFFTGTNCDIGQWPGATDGPLSDTFMNGSIFAIRNQTCTVDGSNPVPLVPDEHLSYNKSLSIKNCPLPAIKSMIIPENMEIVFYASTNDSPNNYIGTAVKDPGVFILGGRNASSHAVQNNLFIVNTGSWNPGPPPGGVWGTSGPAPLGSSSCNYSGGDAGFDSTGQMQISNVSCGSAFWPSLASVIPNGDSYFQSDVTAWTLVSTDLNENPNIRHWIPEGRYCSVPAPCSDFGSDQGCQNGSVGGRTVDAGYSKPGGPSTRVYTAADCAGLRNQVADPSNFACSSLMDCVYADGRGFQGYVAAINGSLAKISIQSTEGDWSVQQFLYCTGQAKLSIGGIAIQRYSNSSAACDEIVPQFCLNTAFLIANPFAEKACACINEQARLNLQFQGLDLPVQCFSDVCSDADPQVYKTGNQAKGCSARLCVQILTINGSAIAAEGFQTLTCAGVVYNTSTGTTNTTPVPVSTATPGGPSLGVVFYVALGLLVFMIILLVVFFLRRFVVQKRKQNRQNQLIVKSFENALKK